MSPHPTQPPLQPHPLFFFSFFCESYAKLIRTGTKRRLAAVPDADEETDPARLFWSWCSGGAWRNRGGMGAARHTPFEEHASKHVLMHLAASQPCQVNGWASGSGLYIPSVPSIVKLQCSLHDYYCTHMHHLVCRYYHGMNIIKNVNIHLCGTICSHVSSGHQNFDSNV